MDDHAAVTMVTTKARLTGQASGKRKSALSIIDPVDNCFAVVPCAYIRAPLPHASLCVNVNQQRA